MWPTNSRMTTNDKVINTTVFGNQQMHINSVRRYIIFFIIYNYNTPLYTSEQCSSQQVHTISNHRPHAAKLTEERDRGERDKPTWISLDWVPLVTICEQPKLEV